MSRLTSGWLAGSITATRWRATTPSPCKTASAFMAVLRATSLPTITFPCETSPRTPPFWTVRICAGYCCNSMISTRRPFGTVSPCATVMPMVTAVAQGSTAMRRSATASSLKTPPRAMEAVFTPAPTTVPTRLCSRTASSPTTPPTAMEEVCIAIIRWCAIVSSPTTSHRITAEASMYMMHRGRTQQLVTV